MWLAGLAAVGLMTGLATPAAKETKRLHVSPEGSDQGEGSRADPLQTLREAQRQVRLLLDDGWESDITVVLHAGTYRLTRPLLFGPGDAARQGGQVITWKAGREGQARISGGRVVEDWEVRPDGTWVAELPRVARGEWEFRELFVDEERRPRARFPNGGYLRVQEVGPDRRTSFSCAPGRIPAGAGDPGLELVFLHDWSTSRVSVTAIDPRSGHLQVADPIGRRADHYRIDHFESHPRFYLENDPAFLNRAGEWFLDRESGKLTYRPKRGETPGEVEVVAPAAPRLLEVKGTPERPVRNLVFEGLKLSHAAWPLPENGWAGGQASLHDIRTESNGGSRLMPAAIYFERAEGCRFTDGEISHIGTSGIWLGARTWRCTVERTRVADIAGNGILVGEGTSHNFPVREVDGQPWWEAAPNQVATANRIRDNVVERCGAVFHGAVGIWVGVTRETQVAHNLVRHHPYTGISLGWVWDDQRTPARENRLRSNHIHDVMQVLSDGGGIYTLGRQPKSRITQNLIHDIPLNVGRAESNGIFFDQGTAGFRVEKNLIFGVDRAPIRWHQAGENEVRNNRFVRPPSAEFVRYNATDPERITYEDNRIIESTDWDPREADRWRESAGPR